MVRESLKNPLRDALKPGVADPLYPYDATEDCLYVMLQKNGNINDALESCAATGTCSRESSFVSCMSNTFDPMASNPVDRALLECW